MILYVKNSANFTLKNLKTLMYLKLNTHTHTHTHTEILHYNYILLISIWKLCKNDFEHLPSCKGFLRFEKSKRGYK